MSYGDGGFYFLQPVGNGYGGIEVRSNRRGGYGAARLPLSEEPLGPNALNSILSRYKTYLKDIYKKYWALPVLTSARVAAEKRYNEAKRAEPVLKAMIKHASGGTDKGVKWRYRDLPTPVQDGLGWWIKSTIIDPRYIDSSPKPMSAMPDWLAKLLGRDNTPSTTTDTTGGGGKGGGKAAGGIPTLGSRLRSGSGGGSVPVGASTLMIAPPASVMGPQAVATDAEQAAAASQADLSAQAVQTVSSATADVQGSTGVMGFLSSTTGKVAAAAALAGAGYYLWQRQQKRRPTGY